LTPIPIMAGTVGSIIVLVYLTTGYSTTTPIPITITIAPFVPHIKRFAPLIVMTTEKSPTVTAEKSPTPSLVILYNT
jgi:hypothetical protein